MKEVGGQQKKHGEMRQRTTAEKSFKPVPSSTGRGHLHKINQMALETDWQF
jgi:hypothetical protein